MAGKRVQKQEVRLGRLVSSSSNKGILFHEVVYNSAGVFPFLA